MDKTPSIITRADPVMTCCSQCGDRPLSVKELVRGLLGELGLKNCETSGALAASQALSASPFEMTSPHRQRDAGGCSAASPSLGAVG